MRTIGIVAEYNPFHSGHKHHLQALRQAFGRDCPVVCAMSGNWVQRGDAALADKWTRTQLALEQGIDLVLELPTLWATSSAETFALGGVGLLAATGVVDTLSFGSEAGDLASLRRVADCLRSPQWQGLLRQGLDRGLSFPAARQQAANSLLGDTANCLRFPNNNLGVEYLRAIQALKAPLVPHTIPRLGTGHDQTPVGGACHVSASYLREKLWGEDAEDLSAYLSPGEVSRLRKDPASLSFCTQGVLARLRTMEEADFARLPDCGEGLSYRLFHAVGEASSLPALYEAAKSKRYPLSRIRRLVLWAFLGLQEEDRPPSLPYLRVLGFGPRGQQLLRQMKAQATLPVVVKPAHIRKLPLEAQQVFRLEARCTALYDLCRREFGRTPGKNEYTQNPVRIS